MLMALLASATLTFTLPAFQPDTLGACVQGVFQFPEQLAHAVMRDELGNEIERHWVSGREGQQFTIIYEWDGSPVQRFITLTDQSGNESSMECRQGWALGDWPTSVPPNLLARRRDLFDVAGRLVRNPVRGRVYFERTMIGKDKWVKKIVIVN